MWQRARPGWTAPWCAARACMRMVWCAETHWRLAMWAMRLRAQTGWTGHLLHSPRLWRDIVTSIGAEKMRNRVYEDTLAPDNVDHAAAGSTRLDWPPAAHTRAC
eukprot:2810782-Alexandrium_andersonii.AAC.1